MSDASNDETRLREWIGNQESISDTLHAAHANKLAATLDDNTSYSDGDPLLPTWHWAYFSSGSLQSKLKRDGHPDNDVFLPPVALPRRMWAGSELIFEKPVLLGETISKTSTIEDVKLKSGSSGALCFVTVRQDFAGISGEHRFTERQTIVYLEDPAPNTPVPAPIAPPPGVYIASIKPSPTFLFRYSALTFNTHRIHYDREYCRNVEGYPGLVVHGPLQATLLASQAKEKAGGQQFHRLTFRARAPLYDTGDFLICSGRDGQLWTQSPAGGVAMGLDVQYADQVTGPKNPGT